MKRIVIGLAALLGLVAIASAQVVTTRQFPEGAQVLNVTPSADFTTGTSAVVLTAISGKWNYICGFTITTGGTTAATTGKVTIAGLASGTLSFTYVFVSSGQGIMGIAWPGCLTASAANQAITVSTPAGGAGTVGSVNAWGYNN
jgi:hypothetical protein